MSEGFRNFVKFNGMNHEMGQLLLLENPMKVTPGNPG